MIDQMELQKLTDRIRKWWSQTPATVTIKTIEYDGDYTLQDFDGDTSCGKDEVVIAVRRRVEYEGLFHDVFVKAHMLAQRLLVGNGSMNNFLDDETLTWLKAAPFGAHICRHCGEFSTLTNEIHECHDCLLLQKQRVKMPKVPHPNFQEFWKRHEDIPIGYWHDPEGFAESKLERTARANGTVGKIA